MNIIGVVLCFWVVLGQADERLWVDAKINGQKAHLIFDTGADRLILFRKGADRLGLRITNTQEDLFPPPGEVVLGATEPCEVCFLRSGRKTSLGVVEIPSYMDMQADGVFGWGPLRNSVLRIDAISSDLLRGGFPGRCTETSCRLDEAQASNGFRIPLSGDTS